ncbi:MAG: DMT family transporter [Bacteroidota bacterium]
MNARAALLATLALIAFAANSILCRLALGARLIDAGSFTLVRLLSGAVILAILVALRDRGRPGLHFRWSMAIALAAYAAPFSFAYLRIQAGTGALILFGAVQTTMITGHLLSGKHLHTNEVLGLVLATGGLLVLTLPGATAPDLIGALLMSAAGIAWGIYSLLGRSAVDPLGSTAGNFLLATLMCVPLAAIGGVREALPTGIAYATASGMLASGVGYAVWYAVLRGLSATRAGIAQLLVPVIAALGGVVFLDETITQRLVISTVMILAGVSLAVLIRHVQEP